MTAEVYLLLGDTEYSKGLAGTGLKVPTTQLLLTVPRFQFPDSNRDGMRGKQVRASGSTGLLGLCELRNKSESLWDYWFAKNTSIQEECIRTDKPGQGRSVKAGG